MRVGTRYEGQGIYNILPVFRNKSIGHQFLCITNQLLVHRRLEVLLLGISEMSEFLLAENLLLPGEADLLPDPGPPGPGLLSRGLGLCGGGHGKDRGQLGGHWRHLDPEPEVGDVVPTSKFNL